MKRAVFGAANYWTSPFQVGSHAWARLFAANGWSVFYPSDPLTPWHFLPRRARADAVARLRLWRASGGEPGVHAWVPLSALAPHSAPGLRSGWVLENWHLFGAPPPAFHAASEGFDAPELLWLDSVRHAGWTKRLRPGRTVLRVADWNAGFGSVPQPVLNLERRLVGEADFVVASAATLAARLVPWRGGQPLHVMRNGVDLEFWREPQPEPPEYQEIPSPRAVYVGTVDEWFDANLVARLAARLPRISFVVIGAVRRAIPSPLPNLHWLGARPRPLARAYIQHARAGIIPFVRNELVDHVCPLKLYEYMACGLPVVATRWAELEAIASPARLVASEGEWVAALEELCRGDREARWAARPALRKKTRGRRAGRTFVPRE